MEGLTIGRIVWISVPSQRECPAIVTQVVNKEEGVVHLTVFSPFVSGGSYVLVNIRHSPDKEDFTWRFPEYVK